MKVRIGLIGCGVVGTGIVHLLAQNGERIAQRDGVELEIAKILVGNKDKPRKGVDPALVTDRLEDLLEDESISMVLEAMGGVDPGLSYAQACLRAGKHYITANKELMAKHWEELNAAAREGNVTLSFEASVAGAVPVIRMLTGSLRPNNITSVMGIINGTTNYILSQMDQFGTGYKAALAKAQELGYAEADPTDDVEGFDAAYKLCILCGLAFGARVKVDDVLREGISKLSAMDIEMAHELGYVIKLLGIGKQHNGGVEARVHPVMIPKTNPLASVGGPFNGVLIGADAAGDLMLYGRGAGDLPTASAMVSDAINVAQGKAAELVGFTPAPVVNDFSCGYYIRTLAADTPGVLHGVSGIFAKHGVSIESCVQKGQGESAVPLIFVTHKSREADIVRAVAEIDQLDYISIGSVIRVEK